MNADNTVQFMGTWLAILTLLCTIAAPVIGFVISSIRNHIIGVSNSAKERDEAAEKEIAAVEARAMAAIRDAEARTEKGYERILQQVNQQYVEINAQLRDMRESLHAHGAKK